MSTADERKRATRPTVARLREIEAERDAAKAAHAEAIRQAAEIEEARREAVARLHSETHSLQRERDEAQAKIDVEGAAVVACSRALETVVGQIGWSDGDEWADERAKAIGRVLRAAGDRYDLDVSVARRGD